MTGNRKKTEQEWRSHLTPDAYHILREKGTEQPFNNRYYANHENGDYCCAGCGEPLFSSDTKYDSGSGWPSFYASMSSDCLEQKIDCSHGMERTEVLCRACGGHLGHVFPDGPKPTGKRFCINSLSLNFHKKDRE